MYKVLIRPLEEADANISWKWRNDPDVWHYTGSSPTLNITKEIEIDWIKIVLSDSTSRRFAITVDDLYVGNIQLTNITNIDAEYHIFIGDKNFWGKGISSIVTYQILHYAKEVLKLNKVYLSVHKDNLTAIKSYLNSGFSTIYEDVERFKMQIKLTELKNPKVSIFVMVYNHEKFLIDCLDGLLQQKCNFIYDIVIGEDCSSDKSRTIISNYNEKYPGKFKLLFHEANIGAKKNQELVLKKCTGKYIAICEGDDYWTDPYKLQKQVDYLEQNKDCSLCFHASRNIINNNTNKILIQRPRVFTSDFKYNMKHAILFDGGLMATNSMVFLREHISEIPQWVINAPIGDWPLTLLLASKGKIGYINDAMSVYRVMAEGSWSKSMKNRSRAIHHYKLLLKMLSDFDLWTEHKYSFYVFLKKMYYKIIVLLKFQTFLK